MVTIDDRIDPAALILPAQDCEILVDHDPIKKLEI